LPSAVIDGGLSRLWARYLDELARRLPALPTRPLPGVADLLERLGARADVALGLLTGNVAEGARLKLGSAGLASWFGMGAFGSDHESRNALPGIALARAREHWGVEFPRDEVVVVGDTPRDVECGRLHGVRTVAVATGRFAPEVLVGVGADRVLADLSDTARALEAIAN
jgi:phosphoglycolate phosphatase-like HAD superfamily hydrolase